ncbi:hypothetical protein WISP_55348 [Willisornis vidua]|uniref:Uncharacterized protein n=1 Tax=Willisornis vidua TaxID=1566151 RepID=A0ABQ9DGW7_9PASS|nr:hypothetical protein WISP_55348 [Willisornis vidua]
MGTSHVQQHWVLLVETCKPEDFLSWDDSGCVLSHSVKDLTVPSAAFIRAVLQTFHQLLLANGVPIQAMISQFLQENAVVNGVKGFTSVQVDTSATFPSSTKQDTVSEKEIRKVSHGTPQQHTPQQLHLDQKSFMRDEDGHLTHRDRDKAEVFNAFFASVCNMDDGPRGSQCPGLEDHDCENDQFPVDPEIVWDLLLELDPYKSKGPDGIHPRILKELADVIAKPLTMIFKGPWKTRGPSCLEVGICCPDFQEEQE